MQVSGAGGSGFTGGGSGGMATFLDSDDNPTDVVGGDDGGAGFLASGLTGTAGTPNAGTGSVVLTWSFTPSITTTATTVRPGNTVPVTIAGLPANTAFTVTFEGTTVITGTSDSAGAATASFTVSSAAAGGLFTLALVVAGTTVATSDPIAVLVNLATTGLPSPVLPAGIAIVLLLGGVTAPVARRRLAVN